jgi:hypothetical protein
MLSIRVERAMKPQFNLPAGRSSAEIVLRAFKRQAGKALPNFTARTLLDEQATNRAILPELKKECDAVGKGDLLIVHLEMNALAFNGGGYWLVAHNGDEEHVADTCVNMSRVSAYLQQARDRGSYVLILLDCRHEEFAKHKETAAYNFLLAEELDKAGIAVLAAGDKIDGRGAAYNPSDVNPSSLFAGTLDKAMQSVPGEILTLGQLEQLIQEEIRRKSLHHGTLHTLSLSMKNLVIRK